MRDSLRRLVGRGSKVGDPAADRIPSPTNADTQRIAAGNGSHSPDNGNNTQLAQNPSPGPAAAGANASPASNNGARIATVPNITGGDDMWMKADKKLREDPKGLAKLEKYDVILKSHLGTLSASSTTTDPRQVLTLLQAEVDNLQRDADNGLRFYADTAKRCFQSLVRCVVKLESLINTAAQSCLPASLACAGVIMLSRLCLDSIDQRHVLFDGLETVAGAIRRLTEYEQLLWKQGATRLEEVEGSLVAACANVIDFQARAALFLTGNPLQGAIRNAFKSDGWDQLLTSIKDAELVVLQCAQRKGLREVEQIFSVIQEVPQRIDEGFARQQNAQASLERQKQVDAFLKQLLHGGCVSSTIKNRNRLRAPGTCNWFTSHSLFKRWRASNATDMPELLYVTADPGCGKSVLSRYLIDDVLPNDGAIICYFFFKDDFSEQKSIHSALCTLLHQLFGANPSLLTDKILATYRIHEAKFCESSDLLWDTFRNATNGQKITVVFDALDECRESDRREIISRITDMCKSGPRKDTPASGLKFILTSRPYDYILRDFVRSTDDQLRSIHLQGDQDASSNEIAEEIKSVVDMRIDETARAFRLSDAERDLMTTRLHAIPNRTYLWITLLFDGLIGRKSSLNKRDILRLTEAPPRGINDAYEAILMKSTDPEMARRVLSIVLVAKKAFTISQMAMALSFDGFGQSREDVIDGIIPTSRARETIKDCCGLFIIFIADKVYLLHQTAREFLLRPELDCKGSLPAQLKITQTWRHGFNRTSSHTVVAEICIMYLSLDLRRHDRTLFEYSARYWADHYLETDAQFQEVGAPIAYHLCEIPNAPETTWIHVYVRPGGPMPSNGPALCLASALGLNAAVKYALETEKVMFDGSRPGINSRSKGFQRSPLSWAIRYGHGAVARQLLDRDEVDVCSKDVDGNTPLAIAASSGRKEIVELLLATGKVDVNAKNNTGDSPLAVAVHSRRKEIVNLLLKTDKVDVESRNEYGNTPLAIAAIFGREEIVELLIATGRVDLEPRNNNGDTPLALAATSGFKDIVELLLATGKVAVDSRNNDGETALDLAVAQGYKVIARLLRNSTGPAR